MGLLLRRTDLAEGYVWVLAALTALATVLILRRRPSLRALRKAFLAFTVAWFAGLGALAVADFPLYQALTEEDHFIEWLSADLLLAAAVIGFVLVVRRARQQRPSPMTVFLAAGCLCAALREIEWGAPFFGDKIWYSRNLFRWRAYAEPSYLEEFARDLKIAWNDPYLVHLVVSGAFMALAIVVIAHLIRHRHVFLAELRQLPRASWGRYFLLGLAVYLGSQAIGKGFEKLLVCEHLIRWRKAHHVGHRVLDEPLELWAAACLLMSMFALWTTQRPAPAPPAVQAR